MDRTSDNPSRYIKPDANKTPIKAIESLYDESDTERKGSKSSKQIREPFRKSKIPILSKKTSTHRLPQRQQIGSGISKIPVPICSRMYFRGNTSKECEYAKSGNSARSCGSCNDAPAMEIAKLDAVGCHRDTHDLSARERVAEAKQLKIMDGLKNKLCGLQADFIEKFESLKQTSPEIAKYDFRYFTVVKNNDGNVIVKEDHWQTVSNHFPVKSVDDLQEKVRKTVKSCVTCLVDNVKVVPNLKNDPDLSLGLEELQSNIEQQQLRELFDLVNASERDAEVSNKQMQKEIQETKKAVEASKEKLAEFKKSHAEESETITNEINVKTGAEIDMQDSQLSEAKNRLKILEKEQQCLRCLVLEHNTEETSHGEWAELIEELNICKMEIITLNRKLIQAENLSDKIKNENNEKSVELTQLETELEEAKKELEMANSRAQADSFASLNKEVRDLEKCFKKLEKEKRSNERKLDELQQERNRAELLGKTLQMALNRASQEHEELLEKRNCMPGGHLDEISNLPFSEAQKRVQVDELKLKLSEVYFKVEELEGHNKEICQKLINVSVKRKIKNKEKIIKQLEDANNQSQVLRIEQEESIIAMEKEVANLKQLLAKGHSENSRC